MRDSGLLAHILPLFKAASGIDVHVVAVGTGQALAMGARGDADALLVHDRAGEHKFVADNSGVDRRDVIYNDFVIVGPSSDPACIHGLKNAQQALSQIAGAAASFASRGDDSGTNRMELRLWKAAGITPDPRGGWYRVVGQGMGATLNSIESKSPRARSLIGTLDVIEGNYLKCYAPPVEPRSVGPSDDWPLCT